MRLVPFVSVNESLINGANENRSTVSDTHCCAPSEGEAEDEGERDALGEMEGLSEDEGETEADGLTLGDSLELGEGELDGLTLGDSLLLGDWLAEGDREGDSLDEGLTEGLSLLLGETEGEGLDEGDDPAILNAPTIITCRAEAETVAWIVPVAPAVARIASAIANP